MVLNVTRKLSATMIDLLNPPQSAKNPVALDNEMVHQALEDDWLPQARRATRRVAKRSG